LPLQGVRTQKARDDAGLDAGKDDFCQSRAAERAMRG